jgi:hypothetical protein
VYTYVCLYVCLSIDSYIYTYISPLIQILLYVHLSKYSCINNNIYTIHLYVYLIRTPTCVCVPQRYLSVPVYMVYNSDSVCTFLSTPHCATRRRTAPHRTTWPSATLPSPTTLVGRIGNETKQKCGTRLHSAPTRPVPLHSSTIHPSTFFSPLPLSRKLPRY